MKYISKKDPTVTAALDYVNEEYNTVRLIYLTGDKAGKSFDVTQSTLKRWWKKDKTVSEEEVKQEIINTPYPEPKEQKYIPKPQSVIEYEESKKRVKCTFELPASYEDFADLLATNHIEIARVNTGYIALKDSTKLKLLRSGIGILATTELAELLAKKGMTSKPCIEKGTPFRFDAKSQEDFDNLINALKELYWFE